ncbi:tripartite tricarboxylate transporter TctB family protein [Mangrovicoccus algicola]|uniref:Tripartite tricarboxylate transporter TctB family protein n=1 Tax=Mangrovicoccus algicola TaxID=2771008 RepID=A0A8J7CIS6_9RHOB|nr:tripartite tricarboxylate transporter TctB family protein [Mangrovicoccus algicola]MBE3639960.1 tripartite tricarboxylate transporter TctB family protein [Mangrovicoccus algicola]
MRANPMLLGLVMAGLGGAVFIGSWQYSPLPGQSYGSDTMPRAVGAFGICVAGALLLQAGAARDLVPRLSAPDWMREPRALAGLAAVPAAVLAYCLLSGWLGFVPVIFALLCALMALQRTPVLRMLLLAALATALVQQIFGRLLLVPLPRGVLSGLF